MCIIVSKELHISENFICGIQGCSDGKDLSRYSQIQKVSQILLAPRMLDEGYNPTLKIQHQNQNS